MVAYFTSELFVCEGAPLIKCNGGRRNSIPNPRFPHFYSPQQRNGLIFKPLPDYSKNKIFISSILCKNINNLELKRSHLHLLWLKIFG